MGELREGCDEVSSVFRKTEVPPVQLALCVFTLALLIFMFMGLVAQLGVDAATSPDLSECPVSTLFGVGGVRP